MIDARKRRATRVDTVYEMLCLHSQRFHKLDLGQENVTTTVIELRWLRVVEIHILTKDGLAVPVPVHGSRDLGVGLLAAIQRQTGVKLK